MPECINCHTNQQTYPIFFATTAGIHTTPICQNCALTHLHIHITPGLYLALISNFVLCSCYLRWSPINE